MLMADFEQISDAQIRDWTAVERFRLITLVHVFEHLYDPLAALRKLRRLAADERYRFLRLPAGSNGVGSGSGGEGQTSMVSITAA